VELARGDVPVRLVRLREQPFTDRLVRKFSLPVRGWRGAPTPPAPDDRPARARRAWDLDFGHVAEMRIRGLGVIDDATLEPHLG